MRLEWLPVARMNREYQIAYLAERNPHAALRMDDAIEMAMERLRDQPHSGRPGRLAGTRELVVSGTPYVVAHRVEAEAVVVLRVMHGAQRWPDRL